MSNPSGYKDNLVITVSKTIQHFNIPVTTQSIKEQLKSHPDYPTLKAVTDTLDHFHIENYPLRITLKELEQIDEPFLAHTFKNNDELQFVEQRTNTGFKVLGSHKKPQILTSKEFNQTFSGVAIFIKPSRSSGEPEYKTKKHTQLFNSLLPASLITLIILAMSHMFIQFSPDLAGTEIWLIVTKLIGLGASLLLVIKDLKPDFAFADKVCQIGKKADCDTVTNHPSSVVFAWVKWSDLGFAYFISTLFLLANGDTFAAVIGLFSIVTLPYFFYSLYLQGFVIKKWCPLCLLVLTVLISEFALALPLNARLEVSDLLLALLYSSLITCLYLLVKLFIQTGVQARNEIIKYKRIKRTPGVLDCLLKREQRIALVVNSRSLLFGSGQSDAKKLSAFISLDCRYCAEMFQKLKTLIASSERLQLQIIPLTKNNTLQKTFTARLYQTYQEEGRQAALELMEQWYDGSYKPNPHEAKDPSVEEKDFMRDNSLMALNNQITDFPALFLESFKLPPNYQLSEIPELADSMKSPVSAPTQEEMII